MDGRWNYMLKKIKDYIIQNKWWLLCGCLVFLVIIPLSINWLFKIPAPLELLDAEWYASDALSFYGTIFGSIATIVGVYLSIDYAQKNYREDERNRVRPYFALTHLKSKSKYNWLCYDEKEKKDGVDTQKPIKEYEEYKPESVFIIIKKNAVDFKYELTQDQKDILATGGMKWQEIGEGAHALTSLKYISLPFEIENVGNGAALCLQVGFYAENNEKMGINFYTVRPNQKLYVHIFSSNVEGKLDRDYCLELVYRDILGNQYSQKYPVKFEQDERTQRIVQMIDLTGKQERQENKTQSE